MVELRIGTIAGYEMSILRDPAMRWRNSLLSDINQAFVVFSRLNYPESYISIIYCLVYSVEKALSRLWFCHVPINA